MRITSHQASVIKTQTVQIFGPQAQVWLFGSRVDDQARGGDIDLLVAVPQMVERPALLPAQLAARLQMVLGEQRIDVVLQAPNLKQQPIHVVARSQGILL
jgi:predicted nucleotidyltransferase